MQADCEQNTTGLLKVWHKGGTYLVSEVVMHKGIIENLKLHVKFDIAVSFHGKISLLLVQFQTPGSRILHCQMIFSRKPSLETYEGQNISCLFYED